jgi:prolyl-tRNA editing enzyme YbaK/EbsC (Cys-tRNA(Pro) deacylase)
VFNRMRRFRAICTGSVGVTADRLTVVSAHLPTRSRLVHDSLRAAGISGEIVVLPDAASTAVLAAGALGIEVGAIANSLVFWSDGGPLLVMTSGAHRVDTSALADRLGRASIRRATAEQVRDATGQAIGGVAPTGHPEPLTTIVDEDLARYPEIWAAGGTPHTVFPLTFDELVRLTDGTVAKVD